MKFLVPCHYLVASGGLLRFERVASVLRQMGHSLTFAPQEDRPDFATQCAVTSLAEASDETWDATIVPGAGFPPEVIRSFGALQAENFGVRVQMVLNDQHLRDRFLDVNRRVAPNIVIFNSGHWPPGSYRDFAAQRFHHLVGGVDTERFHPTDAHTDDRSFVIGAQLSKNPQPLIDALTILPPEFRVRFFGHDPRGVMPELTARFGKRIEFAGPLFNDDLASYYSGLDAMVSTEEHAGWANVVAEAMASGVPVITTTAGTLSTAKHYETALVLDRATASGIADAARWLSDHPRETAEMARRARQHIEQFDWRTYTAKLVDIVEGFDGAAHYSYAPDLKLFGKAQVSERLNGLEGLIARAPSFASVLDLGAAEGVVSDAFLSAGSGRVDAYELDETRVAEGKRRFDRPGFSITRADLSDPKDLERIFAAAPVERYDLVLYLGVHHHLGEGRNGFLQSLLLLANNTVAIRTQAETFVSDGIVELMQDAGYLLTGQHTDEASYAGPLYTFERANG